MTGFALVVLTAGMLAADAKESTPAASADKAPDQKKSITAWELNQMQVIGWLGHPLGKIVTIEGVVADGSYTNCKADAGQTLLRVETVDGKKLPKEHVFQFLTFLSARAEEPKAGSKFKYIGYETGEFTGVPGKTFDYVLPICSTGYYFTTHFVVLRDEMKPKERSPNPPSTPPPAIRN